MPTPTLFTKPVETLDASDASTIIGWPETLTVEFKKTLSTQDGQPDKWLSGGDFGRYGRDRLFKEIVALANTSGGHLLLGVAERKETSPTAEALAPVPRCVDLAERLGRAAQAAIDPPIPLLLAQGVRTQEDGAGLVLFRVPSSRAAPHRAPDRECYVRRGTESAPMNMREIQDMTLAVGRRGEFVDARFARAARQFAEWFAAPPQGRPWVAGFRITAVPVGARFELGRLAGRPGPPDLVRRFDFTVDGRPERSGNIANGRAETIFFPDRVRPIIRGVRQFRHEAGTELSYFDTYQDGVIDVGLRLVPGGDISSLILIGSVIAYVVNVLKAANRLRTQAIHPDCEYGIEVEVHANPPRGPIDVFWGEQHDYDDKVGILPTLPLLLPRLSFGPLGEIDQVVSLLVNDLCDATGAYHPEPLSLSVR